MGVPRGGAHLQVAGAVPALPEPAGAERGVEQQQVALRQASNSVTLLTEQHQSPLRKHACPQKKTSWSWVCQPQQAAHAWVHTEAMLCSKLWKAHGA